MGIVDANGKPATPAEPASRVVYGLPVWCRGGSYDSGEDVITLRVVIPISAGQAAVDLQATPEQAKALIDALHWGYDHAHAVATAAERRAVMQGGLIWKSYQEAYRPYIKADEHEKLKRVPADLDLTPYLGDHDLLARLKKAMKH